ncbi:MAG: hypothetical protein LBT52_01925 [Clostridiales Family XIII bacterium]|jgi:hypothetical protein|nr:hypothetical protein [Clostridiales Family XIII bacterium]
MKAFLENDISRVLAASILGVCLFFSMTPVSWGVFGFGAVSAAAYDAGTEEELYSMIETAPDGSVITITTDITLTSASALAWDDKTLTIKGVDEDVTLARGAAFGDVSLFEIGGTDPSASAPAGVILEDITVDDAGNPGGKVYDGIISAYRQGVAITIGSGVSLLNSGGGSSVKLENLSPSDPGPTLTMLEGSRILYAKSGTGDPGAGVFVGAGAVFNMKGGVIQSNKTAGEGGGVYVAGGATFLMEDGLVKGNTASAGGGVLVSGDGEGGAFVMKGGSITGNILAGVSQNKHGEDVAVGTPSGPDAAKRGTSPDYFDAAYSAEIYPGANIGSDKIGVQNASYNQAVYIPESRSAPVLAGALPQYAGTNVLDSIQAEASLRMPSSDPAYQGLTYAGNVLYSPGSNAGTVIFRLNYPDEIPAYDQDGLNVRNRYGYALAYVALDQSGAAMGAVHIVTPIRDTANLIAEIPAVSGAASYGIAKYYYNKSGALDVNIAAVSGGKLTEKNSGAGGALHFDSVLSGAALVPSPAAYTLIVTPDAGWHTESVTLTAGDGYVTEKDVEAGGEITLYYTDLAQGANVIEAVFVMDDGTISLSMNDAAFVYDGKPHRAAISGIATGDEVRYMYRIGDSGFISAQSNPSFSEVNKVIAGSVAGGVNGEEIIVYVIVTRGAVSVRDSAVLTISPRSITVKPVDRTKEHDGAALRANKVEISSGTLVQGHSLDTSLAVFGGARTKVGTAVSTVTGVSVSGANPDNYAISYSSGSLKVTKAVSDVDDGDGDDGDDDGGSGGSGGSGGNGGNSGGDTGATPGDSVDDDSGADDENGEVVPDGGDEPADATETGDGTAPDDGDASIIDNPTPKNPWENDDGTNNGGGFLVWWIILVAIIIAAIALWFAAASWRRRKEEE